MLDTIPQGPPATTQVDESSRTYQERYDRAKRVAVAHLRADLLRRGKDTPVSFEDLPPEAVDAIAEASGNLEQLEAFREGLPLNSENIGGGNG